MIHTEPQLVEAFNDIVERLYSDLTPDDEDCKAHITPPDLVELNPFKGLTINVVKPADASPGSKYPVLVVGEFILSSFYGIQATHFQWIFGGGFEIGGPSTCVPIPPGLLRHLTIISGSYDGGKVVARSINLKEPVIYVSIGYR